MGDIVDITTEQRIATHLGDCDVCESRLESIADEADPIVALLRAPDPFESVHASSHEFSLDSTKNYKPVVQEPAAATPHDPDRLPEKIDRYFVLGWIARGGFGDVYKAKDPETNRVVAIKVPRTNSKDSSEQFLKEARTAAQLDHPSIVQVHDWGRQNNGSCFVVMQHIDGRSLRDVLKSPISHQRAVDLVIGVANALHYAHYRDIYHRDVKPENILLDDNDQPYLTDFGLAISEDERWNYEGEAAGTYPYMSPEQVNGESQFIDGRTDV